MQNKTWAVLERALSYSNSGGGGGGGVYSSYSLATDLKSQMTFGLGCHIGWIHEWKKIIVEILKMMTSCLDKSAVGLGCLTGYFSGMD